MSARRGVEGMVKGCFGASSNEGRAGNQVGQEQLTPRLGPSQRAGTMRRGEATPERARASTNRELRGPGAEAARGQGRADVCVRWVGACGAMLPRELCKASPIGTQGPNGEILNEYDDCGVQPAGGSGGLGNS